MVTVEVQKWKARLRHEPNLRAKTKFYFKALFDYYNNTN